jgi:outer membrane receptor protein involved in Fe transport
LGNGANAYTTGPPTGVFDVDEQKFAAYGQQTWRPLRWLGLNAGARFDYDSRYDPRLSPRGVVSVNPWHGSTLKVIYSEAFRGPTYFETGFTDNETHIPNLVLKPETVRSGEVSAEQRIGAQRLFVGGFIASYSDLSSSQTAPNSQLEEAVHAGILPAVTPNTNKNIVATYGESGAQVSQFQNLSSVSNYGVNAAFEGSLFNRDLRYGVNFTGAFARQDVPNLDPTMTCGGQPSKTPVPTCSQPLNVTPEVFGNARVSYDLPGVLPVIGVVTSVVGRRPAAGGGVNGWLPTPYAPTQVDLRGTISGAFPGVPGLSYRFIFDYAVASVNPYIIGPNTTPTKQQPNAELVPVDQVRTTIGLQYDLR